MRRAADIWQVTRRPFLESPLTGVRDLLPLARDLGDPVARLALEAEGFTAHRTRKDLHRDARRYTELTVWGWALLRFSWEDVMLRPEWVGWAIAAVGERRAGCLLYTSRCV